MLDLSQVTLVIVDPLNPDLAVKVLDTCCKEVNFGASKVLTATKPSVKCKHQLFKIPRLNWDQYSYFMVRHLHEVVETDFCLVVQADGFVLNANKWSDEFLNYDYIGAKWERDRLVYHCDIIHEHIRRRGMDHINPVGNGGFSLRSKKLIDLCATCPAEIKEPEDVYICNNNRDYFESHGIKYAPEYIADVFSQDPLMDRKSTFGFHGDRGLIYTL
jgi:hypothetical protein